MERKSILGSIVLLFYVIQISLTQERDSNPNFRLPTDLIPEYYNLSLRIEPDSDAFTGTVNITLQLADESSTVEYIYLHTDTEYITIATAKISDENNCTLESRGNQIMKLDCGNITEETTFLYIEFSGKYSTTDGYGLFKTSYSDQGKKQILIESYFEPTFARRAFPCFDEPDLKANFSIQITCPADYTALSDTISLEYETSDDGDYTTTIFETTPKISTYLVTIFVSKFQEATYAFADEEYNFKILTRPGVENLTSKIAGANYAYISEALSNYTGQTFQDTGDEECYQVAIPDYFSEYIGNYGIFFYRERDLLDEGDKTTAKVAQNILQTMTYKISHQWFGGEIATKWWSDIWANEAVPMYFKYIIPNEIDEGFEFTNQLVVEVVQKSMQYDAMPFVESLSSNDSEISSEGRIENKLDEHALLKGATLLHMMNFMLGDDQFKTNLQDHLQNRSSTDTDGHNMLEDLTKYDGIQDLYAASEPWVYLAGFPLLYVKINEATEEKETLLLSQKRFVYPVDNASTFDEDTKWTIPVSYTTATNKNFNTGINVFFTPSVTLEINIYKNDWVLFNIQGRMHYRVNYEEELWRRIINAMKNETERALIHPLSRAQVIDDIFNIARIGDVDYSLVFELAETLVYETDYYPWYSAFNGFSYLLGKMKDNSTEARLKDYILSLMDNVIDISDPYSVSEEENSTHVDILKKVMVLDWACKLGHAGCINFAVEQFSNYKENQTSIEDYNLRPIIFCNGLRYSQNVSNDWRFLFSIYLSSSSVHEQYDALQAIGCAEDEKILLFYVLKLATPILTTDIKRQDTFVVFDSLLENSEGIKAAMSFLGSSVAYIQFIFDGVLNEVYTLSDMILTISEKLTTDADLEWLQDVLNGKTLNGYDDLKKRAKTIATVNNYWAKQYQDVIDELLPQPTTSTTEETTTITESTSTSSTESTVTTTPSIEPTTTSITSTTTHSSSGQTVFHSHAIMGVCALLSVVRRLIYIN